MALLLEHIATLGVERHHKSTENGICGTRDTLNRFYILARIKSSSTCRIGTQCCPHLQKFEAYCSRASFLLCSDFSLAIVTADWFS